MLKETSNGESVNQSFKLILNKFMPTNTEPLLPTFDGATNTTRFFTLSTSTSLSALPAWPAYQVIVVNRTTGNVFLYNDGIELDSERFILYPDDSIMANVAGNSMSLSAKAESSGSTGLLYVAASPFVGTIRG
jgi:hypothetical protein